MNEAKKILHRLYLQDHIRTLHEAAGDVMHGYADTSTAGDILEAVEYLQSLVDAENSPKPGTVE